VIGEQAGFQDPLAGFGMRYAFRSGLLAARSIIEGTDYGDLWRPELWALLRTGAVNRLLFNIAGERGRQIMLARLSRADAGRSLRRLYQPSALSRLLFPVARLRYRSQLRDSSCNHVDCHCVWCRCQSELKETNAVTIQRTGLTAATLARSRKPWKLWT
jgi:flavin-dependent dehydrogenase